VSAEIEQAERTLDQLIPLAHKISAAINTVIVGKPDAVRLAMTVLLAEGHALIEDVPGVGKTLLDSRDAMMAGVSLILPVRG